MFKRLISITIIFSFFFTSIMRPEFARAQRWDMPRPGTMVHLSQAYVPLLIKGLEVHPENPFLFDFILDSGNSGLNVNGPQFKKESEDLIKYFLTSMTMKEEDLWVNLSPYEKNRIIPNGLGKTELGEGMLAQDYLLKQLTASLIYPEHQLGKEFWSRVYTKAQQSFGKVQIPVNTFNKVWIVADKARILERKNTAFVVAAHLKVMLEEDYLSMTKHDRRGKPSVGPLSGRTQGSLLRNGVNTLASQTLRSIIIPELEREVNQGKNFAPLRQMYYSIILSSWYKLALKDAFLNHVYSNKNKISGALSNDPSMKEKIYQQYVQAYKKGVFNYIKEESQGGVIASPKGAAILTRKTTPRKYFSGGEVFFPRPASELIEREGSLQAGDNTAINGNMAMATVSITGKADQAMNGQDTIDLNIVPAKLADIFNRVAADAQVLYGFDNTLIFEKATDPRYSFNPPDTLVADFEAKKAGDCIGMNIFAQRMIYEKLLSVFGQALTINKAWGNDFEFEMEVSIDGKEYHIRSYLIGALAISNESLPVHSAYMEFIHHAVMTKITKVETGEQVSILSDPGFSMPESVSLGRKVDVLANGQVIGNFAFSQATAKDVQEYIDHNSSLAWMKETERGRELARRISERGFLYDANMPSYRHPRRILLDEPVGARVTKMSYRLINIPHYKTLLIVVRYQDGRDKTVVAINLKTADDIKTAVAKLPDEADSIQRSLANSSINLSVLYDEPGTGKREKLSFSIKDLENFVKETGQANTGRYSSNTEKLVKVAKLLGMLDENQRINESVFYQKIQMILERAPKYLEHIATVDLTEDDETGAYYDAVIAAREASQAVAEKEVTNPDILAKLPGMLKRIPAWQRIPAVVHFYEQVYRYVYLSKMKGILKSNVSIDSAAKWLEDLEKVLPRRTIPKRAMSNLRTMISTHEGLGKIANDYLRIASFVALGGYKLYERRQGDRVAYVIKIHPAEASGIYGRLIQTEIFKLHMLKRLKAWAAGQKINGKDIIVEEDNGIADDIFGLMGQGRPLGALADNHTHLGGVVDVEDVWQQVLDHPGKFNWNPSFGEVTQYADLNEVTDRASQLRGEIEKALGKGKVDEEDLVDEVLNSKGALQDQIKEYFALKQTFYYFMLDMPFYGEDWDFNSDFLPRYDTGAAPEKRRVRGTLSSEEFAALSADMLEKVIIRHQRFNSFLEVRIQPNYTSPEDMEIVLKRCAEVVAKYKKIYPHFTLVIGIVFRKKESDETLSKQAQWLAHILAKDENTDIRDMVRYWDAASAEVGNPPSRMYDVVGKILDQYNALGKKDSEGRIHQLRVTYHVAEDWQETIGRNKKPVAHDMVTAMRYVTETVLLMRPVALGHILAVTRALTGEDIPAEPINLKELEQTLAWLEGLQAQDVGVQFNTSRIKKEIARGRLNVTEANDNPLLYLDEPLLDRENRFKLAAYIIKILVQKGIFIEFNPGSKWPLIELMKNGFIMNGVDLSGIRKIMTLSSDIPGMFHMSNGVADEYVRLAEILTRQTRLSKEEISLYLKELADNGRRRAAIGFAAEKSGDIDLIKGPYHALISDIEGTSIPYNDDPKAPIEGIPEEVQEVFRRLKDQGVPTMLSTSRNYEDIGEDMLRLIREAKLGIKIVCFNHGKLGIDVDTGDVIWNDQLKEKAQEELMSIVIDKAKARGIKLTDTRGGNFWTDEANEEWRALIQELNEDQRFMDAGVQVGTSSRKPNWAFFAQTGLSKLTAVKRFQDYLKSHDRRDIPIEEILRTDDNYNGAEMLAQGGVFVGSMKTLEKYRAIMPADMLIVGNNVQGFLLAVKKAFLEGTRQNHSEVEVYIEAQKADPTSILNKKRQELQKKLGEIVRTYSLITIAPHQMSNYPADADANTSGAVFLKGVLDMAKKEGRQVNIIYDPADVKPNVLNILVFPVSAFDQHYSDEELKALFAPQLGGQRALFVLDTMFFRYNEFKRNGSFGFDFIGNIDHHGWEGNESFINEFHPRTNVDQGFYFANTSYIFDHKGADSFTAGALVSYLVGNPRDPFYRSAEIYGILGDGQGGNFPQLTALAAASPIMKEVLRKLNRIGNYLLTWSKEDAVQKRFLSRWRQQQALLDLWQLMINNGVQLEQFNAMLDTYISDRFGAEKYRAWEFNEYERDINDSIAAFRASLEPVVVVRVKSEKSFALKYARDILEEKKELGTRMLITVAEYPSEGVFTGKTETQVLMIVDNGIAKDEGLQLINLETEVIPDCLAAILKAFPGSKVQGGGHAERGGFTFTGPDGLTWDQVKNVIMPVLEAAQAKAQQKYYKQLKGDQAMNAIHESSGVVNGGIDFNPRNMSLEVAEDGSSLDIKFDPAMEAEFEHGDFSGVVPTILRIVPIKISIDS